MKHSQTAVLERGEKFDSKFFTEPYEAPWASEARFFVQRLEGSGDGPVELVTQISPDGLTWCDAENIETITMTGALVSWPVSDFGMWLRLRGEVSGSPVRLRVYFACKE